MPRPKEFDEQQVLDRAMRTFWQHGYHNTSMSDLEQAMGINKFSIYASFQSKRDLLLASLDRFIALVMGSYFAEMEREPNGLQAIENLFQRFAVEARTERGRWGCLVCNSITELAVHDKDVAEKALLYTKRISMAFQAALRVAQEGGDLPKNMNLEDQARFLTGALVGLFVLAKTPMQQAEIDSYVQTVLASLR